MPINTQYEYQAPINSLKTRLNSLKMGLNDTFIDSFAM